MGKYVGLPKIDKKLKEKRKESSKKAGAKRRGPPIPQFIKLNATKTSIIIDYFKNIHENAYKLLMEKDKFQLYYYTGKERRIFLVPQELAFLAAKIRKNATIQFCGIYLGFLKSRRKREKMVDEFYLSYEGGRFIQEYIKNHDPEMFNSLQKVTLDEEGEKKFLYGSDIYFNNILSDTDDLVKRRITFVYSQKGEFLGLALLKVKLVGPQEFEKYKNYILKYSNSQNFLVSLMNLIDAGYYLRKGA